MINLYPNFTLEDIRKLRDDFYYRHQDMDFNAMAREINENGNAVINEIEKIRKQKQIHTI